MKQIQQLSAFQKESENKEQVLPTRIEPDAQPMFVKTKHNNQTQSLVIQIQEALYLELLLELTVQTEGRRQPAQGPTLSAWTMKSPPVWVVWGSVENSEHLTRSVYYVLNIVLSALDI